MKKVHTSRIQIRIPWIKLRPDPTRISTIASNHRLNKELDLQSLIGLLCTAVGTHWLKPRNSPPSSRMWAHIRRRSWSARKDHIPNLTVSYPPDTDLLKVK
jgi:hypothetical protein